MISYIQIADFCQLQLHQQLLNHRATSKIQNESKKNNHEQHKAISRIITDVLDTTSLDVKNNTNS